MSKKARKLEGREERLKASDLLVGVQEELDRELDTLSAVKITVANLERKAKKLEYAAHGLSLRREEERAAKVNSLARDRYRAEKYQSPAVVQDWKTVELKNHNEAESENFISPDLQSRADTVMIQSNCAAKVRNGVSWLSVVKYSMTPEELERVYQSEAAESGNSLLNDSPSDVATVGSSSSHISRKFS